MKYILVGLIALHAAGCGRWGGPSLEEARDTLMAGDPNTAQVQLLAMTREEGAPAEAFVLLAKTQLIRGDLDAASQSLQSARSKGADASDLAELEARLRMERGELDELLSWLDSSPPGLDAARMAIYRGRALLGLGRIPEALVQFSGIQSDAATRALAEAYSAQANVAFKRWATAEKHAQKAIELAPTLPQGWMQQGLLAMQRREAPLARDSFRKANQHAGDQLNLTERSLALSQAFRWAIEQGDLKSASEIHGDLVALLPQDPLTVLLGAELRQESGDIAGAVTDLERLAGERPDLPAAQLALAGALVQTGSLNRAGQELGQLQLLSPGQPVIKAAMDLLRVAGSSAEPGRTLASSQALLALGQVRGAQRLLEAARQLPEKHPAFDVALAQVLMANGFLDRARDLAASRVEQSPEDVAGNTVLGQVLSAQKQYAEAAAAFAKVWNLAPSGATARSLALARFEAGEVNAIEPLDAWLKQEPRDLASQLVRAELLSRTGHPGEAIAAYEAALQESPRQPAALNQLALLYQRAKDPRALETARMALETAPARHEMMDTYAWLLVENGMADEAVTLLRDAIRRGGVDPEIRYHLAAALVRRAEPGDIDEARVWLADLLAEAEGKLQDPQVKRLLESI